MYRLETLDDLVNDFVLLVVHHLHDQLVHHLFDHLGKVPLLNTKSVNRLL